MQGQGALRLIRMPKGHVMGKRIHGEEHYWGYKRKAADRRCSGSGASAGGRAVPFLEREDLATPLSFIAVILYAPFLLFTGPK
jgi:hypothetical protein